MTIATDHIFAYPPGRLGQEKFLTLFETDRVPIERIVANGFRRPSGVGYDQAENEWVIVLRGIANVEFEDGNVVGMKEGDYCTPRDHIRQRSQHTDRDTIWPATHVQPRK